MSQSGANPASTVKLQRGTTQAIEQTGNRAANQAQQNAAQASAPARALPFGQGVLLKAVSFVGGVPKMLAHGLGQAYSGALVMTPRDSYSDFAVNWTSPTASPDPTKLISITAEVTCVADVWVYA